MTHKERFLAAMNFIQPDDKVAMFELGFQIYSEYVGEDPVVGYEYAKLSMLEKEVTLGRNAELMVKAAAKAGHDAIRDIGGYWEVAPGMPTLLWLPEQEDRLAQIKAIKKEAGNEFAIVASVGSFAGTIPDGAYINEYVMRIYDEPEEVLKDAESFLQNILTKQRAFGEIGVDGVLSASDIAFNSGTFLPPGLLDEIFFPYLTRWADECKKDGLLSILHSDGNLYPVMDRMLESGISALQCIDPIAGMEMGECKNIVNGKLALIGNVDCAVLHMGTPQEIDALCKNVIESAGDGIGFVFGGCNAIFKGISAENYQVMVDARHKYGRSQGVPGGGIAAPLEEHRRIYV
ncbi:MAG: hypothetical protein FWC73_02680 [Defluviitaleaceae bacterium]|nr:hypothetical protein [Defluviitaleaceae bacterium]